MKKALFISLFSFISTGILAQDIPLNPTPQEIHYRDGFLDLSKGLRLSRVPATLLNAVEFKPAGSGAPRLRIYVGSPRRKLTGISQADGAYRLHIHEKGIDISALNDLGAFYALQTLRQLKRGDRLPFVEINDYPTLPFRGVVEGFYGNPWSHRVRLSLIEYYGRYKMNSYLYGPKDDPYHSSPNWREPYPEKEKAQLFELIEASRKNRVNFVWAIHPGKDIQWNESDYSKLLQKFNWMYDLGVRHFAVFFDDIEGIGTNPVKQAELLNRLHHEFVSVKKDVGPLIMCPTEYTELWASPAPDGYLSVLGKNLHPAIHVMWTGHTVSGDITNRTLEFVNSRIRRPAFIWWNFPVTDYIKNFNMQGPVYGLTHDANPGNMAGFVSNPMEHGEASKLALYGVADYTWNVKAYKPLENWEAALKVLMPGAAEAYRTFAIHSTDNETGYRRNESWETHPFDPLNYTKPQYDSLYQEFEKISKAPATIFNSGQNRELTEELRPWLVEFEKLGKRGIATLDALKLLEQKSYPGFWNRWMQSEMTAEDLASYNAHKSGTRKLQPFISSARDEMAARFYTDLSGVIRPRQKAIGAFSNIHTRLPDAMLDGNRDTWYHSAQAQRNGHWIGLDLGEITGVHTIEIDQGRNDTNDVDYFDHAALQISTDSENWTTLQDSLVGQYVIRYSGLPQQARFVRLLRLDESKRTNWLAVRRFAVNPRQEEPVLITNIPMLSGKRAETLANKTLISPILEVVNVSPGQYFGIEYPSITAIRSVEARLGTDLLKAEYSSDGRTWDSTTTSAKIVRFRNTGNTVIPVRINKFEITAVPNEADISAVFDQDIQTSFAVNGNYTFPVQQGSKELVMLSRKKSDDSNFEVVELNKEGGEIRRHSLNKAFEILQLSPQVFQVGIDGDLEVHELIFR